MIKRLTTGVISAHIAVIVFLLFAPVKKAVKPHKHIAVRTVQPKSQPVTIISNTTPRKTTTAPPKARTSPPAKKTPTKPQTAPAKTTTTPQTKRSPEAKSKPIPQKTAVVEKGKPIQKKKNEPSPEVWKEIDEALAKIDTKVYPASKSKLDVPQFEVPSFDGLTIESKEDDLVSFLHSSLNLPEFGEVTIQLTIRRNGTVSQIVVKKAESQKNKAYLEQHLPLLQFPLILEKEQTFTLTFCNEI